MYPCVLFVKQMHRNNGVTKSRAHTKKQITILIFDSINNKTKQKQIKRALTSQQIASKQCNILETN